MRIAMLAWESMHSVAVGGLAPHITELSAGLARRGHEIHVFTRVGPGQRGYDLMEGVHYHRCTFVEHPDFISNVDRMCDSFIWHIGETEAHIGKRFDIIHGHDWLSTRGVTLAKDERHTSTVFTVHSTEYGRCGNVIWDEGKSRRIRDLEWLGTYVADRVICVSQSLRREVGELYSVPDDKMFSVYNGVKVGKFDVPIDVQAVRSRYSVGSQDPLILFAGRVTWQKGPDLLVEAIPDLIKKHPRATIVFAGDGDMRPGLESRVSAIGATANTRFLGHRNGQDLIGLFKAADLVCVPSRNEPFGIVILEAWSAHKAVVATRTGGPAEFVTHEQNGLTVPMDIRSIGEGLDSLLGDKDRARRMGLNGRREAELRFTWDHSAEATEKVYRSILSPNGNGQAVPENGIDKGIDMARQRTPSSKTTTTPATDKAGPTVAPAIDPALQPTEQEIRVRAYNLYLARKGAPGDSKLDWLQAERELREEKRTANMKKKSRSA